MRPAQSRSHATAFLIEIFATGLSRGVIAVPSVAPGYSAGLHHRRNIVSTLADERKARTYQVRPSRISTSSSEYYRRDVI
jgi:hypothetical protein